MSQNKKKNSLKRNKQQPLGPMIMLGVGGLLVIILAVFALNQSAKPKATIEVTGAPSLKVDQEKIDLGDKKLGSTVQVSFQLTNVGDQPLRFSEAPYIEVKEGC